MTTVLMLLVLQDKDVAIVEHFIDAVVYENLAVTRVRLTFENRNSNVHRELGATIMAPKDAVAFEFDGYGTVQGDNQSVTAPERAMSLYMQLVDAARREGLNPEPVPVADPKAAVDELILNVRNQMNQATTSTATVMVMFSNSDEGVSMQDYGDEIERRRPPAEPELLQQVGPGEFQLLVYPIPARSKQVVEVYFASEAKRDSDGYTFEMPVEILSGPAVEDRLVHVRVISEGEVQDLKCVSHKTAREEDHQEAGKRDKRRRELRISGRSFGRGEPVMISYALGDGAKPADLSKFEGEPSFRFWDKAAEKSADPVLGMARAHAALKTASRIAAMMADTKTPLFDKEKTALEWAAKEKLVTMYSSSILAESRLYKYIGAEVPPGPETPFKSLKLR